MLFDSGDVCEIVAILKKDHYFDKRNFLVGKKIRIICNVASAIRQEDYIFNGWAEFLEPVPEIKTEKGGFISFTGAELKIIKPAKIK